MVFRFISFSFYIMVFTTINDWCWNLFCGCCDRSFMLATWQIFHVGIWSSMHWVCNASESLQPSCERRQRDTFAAARLRRQYAGVYAIQYNHIQVWSLDCLRSCKPCAAFRLFRPLLPGGHQSGEAGWRPGVLFPPTKHSISGTVSNSSTITSYAM